MTVGSWWLHSFRMANQYKRMGRSCLSYSCSFLQGHKYKNRNPISKTSGTCPVIRNKKRYRSNPRDSVRNKTLPNGFFNPVVFELSDIMIRDFIEVLDGFFESFQSTNHSPSVTVVIWKFKLQHEKHVDSWSSFKWLSALRNLAFQGWILINVYKESQPEHKKTPEILEMQVTVLVSILSPISKISFLNLNERSWRKNPKRLY